jgi:hypothetical protein
MAAATAAPLWASLGPDIICLNLDPCFSPTCLGLKVFLGSAVVVQCHLVTPRLKTRLNHPHGISLIEGRGNGPNRETLNPILPSLMGRFKLPTLQRPTQARG